MQPLSRVIFQSGLIWLAMLFVVSLVDGQTQVEVPASSAAQESNFRTDDWSQWRGPKRDGKLSGLMLPNELGQQQLKKLWAIRLGPSYSGPLVVGDRVFTTQTIQKKFEAVTAHDRNTGEKLWQQQWEGSMSVPFFAKANGDWIRATPAYDSGRLYVAGMKDKLVCLKSENGDVVWELDFPKVMKSKIPAFGFVSSPLVDGDAVYVQAGQAIFKLNKLNGDVIW